MQSLTLQTLQPGQCATVCGLGPCGALRRRLRDVGLTDGTAVVCVGRSPLGDPAAYRVRGAVLALRGRDAQAIYVREVRADG